MWILSACPGASKMLSACTYLNLYCEMPTHNLDIKMSKTNLLPTPRPTTTRRRQQRVQTTSDRSLGQCSGAEQSRDTGSAHFNLFVAPRTIIKATHISSITNGSNRQYREARYTELNALFMQLSIPNAMLLQHERIAAAAAVLLCSPTNSRLFQSTFACSS